MTRVEAGSRLMEDVLIELDQAISAASSAWDRAPTPGEWTPKQVADHIVTAMLTYLDFAADALHRVAFDWDTVPYDFPTPQVALDAVAAVRRYAASLLDGLPDAGLDADVPAMGDWPNLPQSVEGCLRYCDFHGRMHARQIIEAVGAA